MFVDAEGVSYVMKISQAKFSLLIASTFFILFSKSRFTVFFHLNVQCESGVRVGAERHNRLLETDVHFVMVLLVHVSVPSFCRIILNGFTVMLSHDWYPFESYQLFG